MEEARIATGEPVNKVNIMETAFSRFAVIRSTKHPIRQELKIIMIFKFNWTVTFMTYMYDSEL